MKTIDTTKKATYKSPFSDKGVNMSIETRLAKGHSPEGIAKVFGKTVEEIKAMMPKPAKKKAAKKKAK